MSRATWALRWSRCLRCASITVPRGSGPAIASTVIRTFVWSGRSGNGARASGCRLHRWRQLLYASVSPPAPVAQRCASTIARVHAACWRHSAIISYSMCRAISKQIRPAWPSCIARAALGCRISMGMPLCTNVLPKGDRMQQGCAPLHAQQWRDQADPHTNARLRTRRSPGQFSEGLAREG